MNNVNSEQKECVLHVKMRGAKKMRKKLKKLKKESAELVRLLKKANKLRRSVE